MKNDNEFNREEMLKITTALGRIGGKANMARMTSAQRSQMARDMANARWAKVRAEKAANDTKANKL
jgi:hypothetical protein